MPAKSSLGLGPIYLFWIYGARGLFVKVVHLQKVGRMGPADGAPGFPLPATNYRENLDSIQTRLAAPELHHQPWGSFVNLVSQA